MKYLYTDNEEDAVDVVAHYRGQGYNAYHVVYSSTNVEIRYWGKA